MALAGSKLQCSVGGERQSSPVFCEKRLPLRTKSFHCMSVLRKINCLQTTLNPLKGKTLSTIDSFKDYVSSSDYLEPIHEISISRFHTYFCPFSVGESPLIVTLRCGKITVSIQKYLTLKPGNRPAVCRSWQPGGEQIGMLSRGMQWTSQGMQTEDSHLMSPFQNGGGMGSPHKHQSFGYADTQLPVH